MMAVAVAGGAASAGCVPATFTVLVAKVTIKVLAAGVSAWTAVRIRPLAYQLWSQISDRIHRFSELQSRHKALESVAEAQNAVVAHLSHEARGPLQIVQACLGFAAEDAGDLRAELRDRRALPASVSKASAIRRDVKRATEAAASLTRLVDTVLDLSLLQAGLMRVRPEPVSLHDCIGAAVSTVTPHPGVALVSPNGGPHGCTLLGERWPGSHVSLGAAARHLVTDPARLTVCVKWAVETAAAFTTRGFIAVVATEGFAAPGQWFPIPSPDVRPPSTLGWSPHSTALPVEAAEEFEAYVASTVPVNVSTIDASSPAMAAAAMVPSVVVEDSEAVPMPAALPRRFIDATMPGHRPQVFEPHAPSDEPGAAGTVQIITDSTPQATAAAGGGVADGSPGHGEPQGMTAAGGATPPGLNDVMLGLLGRRSSAGGTTGSPQASVGSENTPGRGVNLAFRSPKASRVSPVMASSGPGGRGNAGPVGSASSTARQPRRRCIVIRVIDTGSRLDAVTTESAMPQSRVRSGGSGVEGDDSEGTTADEDDEDDEDDANGTTESNGVASGGQAAAPSEGRASSIFERFHSQDLMSAIGLRQARPASARIDAVVGPIGTADSAASDALQGSKTATAMHRTSGLGLDRVQRIAALLGCSVRQLQADGKGAAELVAPLAPALRSAGVVVPESAAVPVAVFELWMPIDIVAHPSWLGRLDQLRRVSTARTGMAPLSVGPSITQPEAASVATDEAAAGLVARQPATASPLPPRTILTAGEAAAASVQRTRAQSHEADARHGHSTPVTGSAREASTRAATATPGGDVHPFGVQTASDAVSGPASAPGIALGGGATGSSSAGLMEHGVAGSPGSRRSARRPHFGAGATEAGPSSALPMGPSAAVAAARPGAESVEVAPSRSGRALLPSGADTRRSRSESPSKVARPDLPAGEADGSRVVSRDRAQRDRRREQRKVERRSAAKRRHAAGVGAGLSVLFVDDDEAIRRTTVRMLQRLGVSVHVLTDGDKVEAWLDGDGRGIRLDLVLTDILMPGLDGERLCQRLAARHVPFPVVAATGTTTPETLERLPSLGFAAVLRKPYSAKDLAKIILNVREGQYGPPLAAESP